MADAPKQPRTGAELAHVADPTPPSGFLQFWSAFADKLWAAPAVLTPATDPALLTAAGATGLTHTLVSLDNTRVGVRITPPQSQPRGVVITLHGYTLAPREPFPAAAPWAARGLATIALRVRGYPGSQFDTGDLTASPGGYVTHHLHQPERWSVAGAVTDIVNTFRAARALFGPAIPIAIHGDSFGGGLAVIAASTIAMRDGVYRLALGVPTLGDWPTRLVQPQSPGSIGDQVRRAIDAHPDQREAIVQTLRLFDAVVHARRVTCPVVCKLALRDPVVPPSAAAAVFNALATGAGWKWRYCVAHAHTPATTPETRADLRRHAEYEQLITDFLDPAEYPQTIMQRWEPTLGNL